MPGNPDRRKEELAALRDSYGWACVKEAMQKRISGRFSELLNCSLEKVIEHREAIRAMRELLRIPDFLIEREEKNDA